MKAIPAIYQNGAFHPLTPIELPEETSVEILLPVAASESAGAEAVRRTAGAWANLPSIDDTLSALDDLRCNATFRDDEA